MTIAYDNMDTDFFGMPGELLTSDCTHRLGFSHVSSQLIKHKPDDSALARIHELSCLTCSHVWKFAQKSLPAREHQNG